MSRFYIKLNGWEPAQAFHKQGVSWRPIRVTGPNQGTSQGGSVIVDLIRTKDLLTLQGNDVRQSTYSKLKALCENDYITAEYEHPATGEIVTKVMIPELSEASQKRMAGGRIYMSGWTLTLEER